MDSYEFYLLFHKDSSEFISALDEKNDEVLLALEKLLKNSKIAYEFEKKSCLKKIWNLMKVEKDFDEKLETVFKDLLKHNMLSSEVKLWMLENLQKLDKGLDCNVKAIMRVTKNVTEVFINSQDLFPMFEQIANVLIDLLFREKPYHAEIIGILQLIMTRNDDLNKFVCEKILERSRERNDRLGIANLCYFFEGICKLNLEFDCCEMLSKYFDSSEHLARKQGLYLIKCLIQHKKLSNADEESFKKFTTVVEALQDSPHLILPTLKLIGDLNFTETYADFSFSLLHMVITHESAPVKNWGLNFILSSRKEQLNDKQIVIVLSALNSTCLYDPDENSIDNEQFKGFIQRNFEAVFRLLTHINWISVPLYRVLEIIVTEIQLKDKCEIDEAFISTLRMQTTAIPLRAKNLLIRSGIKALFSKVLIHLRKYVGVKKLITHCANIFDEQLNCLEGIFNSEGLSNEDLRNIISDENLSPDFVRFILTSFCRDKNVTEIGELWRLIPTYRLLLMEAVCKLARTNLCGKEIPFYLTDECVKELVKHSAETKDTSTYQNNINIFRHGLKFVRFTSQKDLTHFLEDSELKAIHFSEVLSFDDVELLLELYDGRWKTTITVDYEGSSKVLIRGHIFLRHLNQSLDFDNSSFVNIFEDIKSIAEDCESFDELLHLIELTGRLSDERMKLSQENLKYLLKIIETLSITILNFPNRSQLLIKFVKMLLISVVDNIDDCWINNISAILEDTVKKLSENEKPYIANVIIQHLKLSNISSRNNSVKDFVKNFLMTRVIEINMMTREQRIEMATGCEIELMDVKFNEINEATCKVYTDKKTLRLRAAEALACYFRSEFTEIVESFMEEFAKASKKKPRYFPNSWIHRMKLHCLQPMVFCTTISKRAIDILFEDLLYINNQPNVTYLIEIILAKHGPSVIEFLTDEVLVSKLKSPAIKSIFNISVMQLKKEDAFTLLAENFFGIAEVKLEAIHDVIMPFTMGQNYGVRSSAQAAIILIYKHVKSLFGARESSVMSRIAKSCEIISESVKFKNASRYFENLKQDFRFTLKFDVIWTVDVFYWHIPLLTKMSFDEVIAMSKQDKKNGFELKVDFSKIKIAVENETDIQVVEDEIIVPIINQPIKGDDNLQQKYLPHKYQIPSDKIMKMLPLTFQNIDKDKEFCLKPRSSLTVVASLVSHAPNLGGLARTCEIFGVANYVIESLKLTENADFKALSKTAEKWMKISEIKQWNLFDYLMGMKLKGYTIVGAEQSARSVSLINAEIPEMSVLLLGNENEGIPANLLSLLDLTLELPQTGVIRSLNVHVTGAIVIWEYAKQHIFKNESVAF